ncbi:MAG: DUF502 domain-containing protein [Planctomycetes bacterium]|nr:DUF502 domain-containing protein [Planctomycetota bacterium]
MKKLFGYFVKGLLVSAPLAATVYVVYLVFNWVDGWLRIPYPGVGFVATIILITLTGYLASGLFFKGLMKMLDAQVSRIPLIKLIYSSLKDLMKAFVGEKKMFDRPVLVKLYDTSEAMVIGFITRDDLSMLGIKDSVAVYLPQSYNFAGNLIIVPRRNVTPLDKNGPEVMAFIVSAGLSGK